MSETMLYPWLQPYWDKFLLLKSQSRIPHGIMIRAQEGLGTEKFAKQIAETLLCQSPVNDKACGKCSDCQLIAAGTHPDYHQVSIEDDKKQISITQIRALVQKCAEKSHQGGYRIVIINPADAMNTASANALLKTLEEPGENTLIILLSDSNSFLPATIRSRCQLISVMPPKESVGLNWLAEHYQIDIEQHLLALRLSSHAPLKAKALLESDELLLRSKFLAGLARAAESQLDPVKLVANVLKTDINDILDWLYSLVIDSQKLKNNVKQGDLLNQDQINLLQKINSGNSKSLEHWLKQITEARRLAASQSNINPQLILEDLMFRWIAIFR